MDFLKRYCLPFVVFLTGACVLIIEVVATRILSPYYGNTIFTVSSVISVVLAALSFGYYFGGKLADKYPAEKNFYTIILISGLSVILLHLLNLFLLPRLGYNLSIVSGPIISAVVLFFLPSLLLGMLSPFAIKLQELRLPKRGIGSITGEIFFWSTLGSIFGSLLAGFVLIPQFGISHIILVTGIILIILGLFPIIKFRNFWRSIFKTILFVIIGIFFVNLLSSFNKSSNIIYSYDGVYEKITIYDGEYGGKPTRFFQQDRSLSGAMFLNSDELVYDYTKYYALYKVFKPNVTNALVIGGGAYSIPKALLKDIPQVTIDVSEIEPALFELAKKYFKIKETDHIHNYVKDGRRFLNDTKKKYDLIFSDVYYSLFSVPAHFTTQEFFNIAKNKLNKNGIFIASLIGDLSRQAPSLIMSEIKTFRTVFPNSYFFAVDSPKKTGSQNIIFVGYNSDKKINLNYQKLAKYQIPIIQSLREKNINLDRFELSPYSILTDNFSPIEYLTSKILQKNFNQQKFLDGKEMLAIIDQQLRYGPRYISATGHKKVQKFLIAEMSMLTKEIKIQSFQHTSTTDGKTYRLNNIIAHLWPEKKRRIILATHYDSKKFADRDLAQPNKSVPGANDSSSGVAILLELSRALLNSSEVIPNVGVDVIFFDGEEGEENMSGNYKNWKPLGSIYFAEHLSEIYMDKKPIIGVVLDMICDRDLEIIKERSSVKNAPEQVEAFWEIGKKISSSVFKDVIGEEIHDDHTSLNQVSIPSFLVIDFKYTPFHTTEDTIDKCSSSSLEIVGNTLIKYIYSLK